MTTGEKGADGQCRFKASGKGDGSGRIEIGVEVSFDPKDCTRHFMVTSYDLDEVPDQAVNAYIGTMMYLSLLETHRDAQSDEKSMNAIAASGAANLYVAYVDPVMIEVAEVMTEVNWTGTNSCISAASPVNFTDQEDSTGWSRQSYFPAFSFNCNQAAANTIATFINDAFCPGAGNTTYARFYNTSVRGYPGGSSDYVKDVSKSGGCHALLHEYYWFVN